MKKIILILVLFLGSNSISSQSFCQQFKKCNHLNHISKSGQFDNLRSDTIDVLNYKVKLDITDFNTGNIYGSSNISFVSKQPIVSSITFDLLKLTIDSVKSNGLSTFFSYNDTLLIIQLLNSLSIGDTGKVDIFYHGIPQQDASGWGGWYKQNDYVYNLGVGFAADPHNYGRVWHPCFDNFVERATYEIEIITDNTKTAYSNGVLVDTVTSNGKLHSNWSMQTPIPTYLATVAVAPYTHVLQTYVSNFNSDTVPVYLISKASDTINFKNSFLHLFDAMDVFENKYGQYKWDKVGFYLVPFNGGAMEHATAIAYPLSTVNGAITYETLMAHELSHHWWGNLVTCRTDEDMWINEGMASYSEHLFLEWVYGYDQYINEVKLNHKDVLHHAHINDNGYLSLHGVPHTVTYGDHSYNKGADVVHTLRSYMGETNFFNGLQSILNTFSFQDIDAFDFRDQLNLISGIDVTQFFEDWIFGSGFPHFSIDSFNVTPFGNDFTIDVDISQKLKGTNDLFDSVPLEITFVNSDWTEHTETFIMGGISNLFSFSSPFEPQWMYLNGADKIAQAVTGESLIINSTGIKDLSYSMCRITTNSIVDSSLIRVEHHWASPDGFKDLSKYFLYELSQERYWRVAGNLSNDFTAKLRFSFNGTSTANGNLDNNLFSISGFHEDSIQLFYRSDPADDWNPLMLSTIQNLGSFIDGYGFVEIDTLMIGEYTWGWKKSNVGLTNLSKKEWSVFPNPVKGNVIVDVPFSGKLLIYDLHGKLINKKILIKGNNQFQFSDSLKGTLLFVYQVEDKRDVKKVIFEL